jgi:hypothetical protein
MFVQVQLLLEVIQFGIAICFAELALLLATGRGWLVRLGS